MFNVSNNRAEPFDAAPFPDFQSDKVLVPSKFIKIKTIKPTQIIYLRCSYVTVLWIQNYFFQEISDPDPTQLLSKEAKAKF